MCLFLLLFWFLEFWFWFLFLFVLEDFGGVGVGVGDVVVWNYGKCKEICFVMFLLFVGVVVVELLFVWVLLLDFVGVLDFKFWLLLFDVFMLGCFFSFWEF